MKVCIDTNAYSAFKRGEEAIAELLEAADEVLVSAVVLGELYVGFALGAQEQRNFWMSTEGWGWPTARFLMHTCAKQARC